MIFLFEYTEVHADNTVEIANSIRAIHFYICMSLFTNIRRKYDEMH